MGNAYFCCSFKMTGVAILLGMLLSISTLVVNAEDGPHSGLGANLDTCNSCHRSHTASSPGILASSSSINAFCFSCHNGTGAKAIPVISSHSNADFSGRKEASFDLDCTQCHNPHGDENSLFMIRDYVRLRKGSAEITSGPVKFAASSGLNSYDDGVSNPASRVCVTCHINSENPGYPMTNHVGGANHLNGADYSGQDCMTCHPHSADEEMDTRDGFMPNGDCMGCHSSPQDNGDSVPANGRRAVVDEFSKTSHHVQGPVEEEDCTSCHFLGNHQQGQVELIDVDNPGTVITLHSSPADNTAEALKLEAFCLACHDSDGAGGQPPFSDGNIPPVVNNSLWASSAHKTGGNSTCFDCHDNGHGSNKLNLLAPWNAVSDGNPVDAMRVEERFCYQCHDGSRTAVNIEAQFGQSSHHNISADDPQGGEFIECSSCHNPHVNNSTNKLSNPDNTQKIWTGSDTDFCLTCHDADPPPGVSFPAGVSGTGYNKSSYLNTSHDNHLGNTGCRNCHDAHGAPFDALMLDEYVTTDFNAYAPGNYQLCWRCHVEDEIIEQENAFRSLHKKHVNSEDSPCVACHDVHAPYDNSEPGLISFVFAVKNEFDFQLIDGYDHSTAFWFDSEQYRGSCYLACHNENHQPLNYQKQIYSYIMIVTPTPTSSPTPSPTLFGTPTPTPTFTIITPTPTLTTTQTIMPTTTLEGTITPVPTFLILTATPTLVSMEMITPSPTPVEIEPAFQIITATPKRSHTATPSVTAAPSTIPIQTPSPEPAATSTLTASVPTQNPITTPTATYIPTATMTLVPVATNTPLSPATPTLTTTPTPTASSKSS
jgi:predicted CXXCH cytochrome family protein